MAEEIASGTSSETSEQYAPHLVPRSAFEVLQALHDQGCIVGKKVWIDAICINQADNAEKSAQVRIMADIYRLAASTAVYVGPSLPSTERAIKFLLTLEEYFDALEASEGSERSGIFSFEHLFKKTSTSRESEDCLALREHFGRPWFGRTWVVQEAVLASHLSFIWGGFCLPWEPVEKFVRHERRFNHGILVYEKGFFVRKAISAMKNIEKLKSNRADFSQGWQCNISFALYCCGESMVSDSRYKVYGLLGLLHHPTRVLTNDIIPDYSEAASTVYTEVT